MKKKLPEQQPPPGFVRGADIGLANWDDWRLAIDERGEAQVVLGFRPDDHGASIPWYACSVAERYPESERSHRFIRLYRGTIRFGSFFYDKSFYQIRNDVIVRLPSGSDRYFGVIQREDSHEDTDLTRKVFGATISELEAILKAFHTVQSGIAEDSYYPRVTFSRRSNRCDLTEAFIPPNFPYLAFTSSEFYLSHVSLSGFFRTLYFLCVGTAMLRNEESTGFEKKLIEAGASPEALKSITAFETVANNSPLFLKEG